MPKTDPSKETEDRASEAKWSLMKDAPRDGSWVTLMTERGEIRARWCGEISRVTGLETNRGMEWRTRRGGVILWPQGWRRK